MFFTFRFHRLFGIRNKNELFSNYDGFFLNEIVQSSLELFKKLLCINKNTFSFKALIAHNFRMICATATGNYFNIQCRHFVFREGYLDNLSVIESKYDTYYRKQHTDII